MTKNYPVLIKFENKQTDEHNESNVIRIRTEGKIYHRAEETVLFYKQNEALEGEDTSFTLTIPKDKREVSMLRFGDHKLSINFCEGSLWESSLRTPYGDMPMQFATQVLDYEIGEQEGYVNIHYTMELNHQKPLRNEVKLSYKPI